MALTGSSPDDRMEQVMTALDEGLQGLELDDDAANYLRGGCLPEFASLSEADWQQSYTEIMQVARDVGQAAAEDATQRSPFQRRRHGIARVRDQHSWRKGGDAGLPEDLEAGCNRTQPAESTNGAPLGERRSDAMRPISNWPDARRGLMMTSG